MLDDLFESITDETCPVVTISRRITNEEAAAREHTAQKLVDAITREAHTLLETDGPISYMAALTQAIKYLKVLEERQPDELADDEEWLEAHFRSAPADNTETLERSLAENHEAATEGLAQTSSLSPEARNVQEAHATAAALMGQATILKEHIQGIAAQDQLSHGHCQAAIGVNMNITMLMEQLDQLHDQHCYHCNLIDDATEQAQSAQALADAMRPAIRQNIKVALDPSLRENSQARESAQELASEILDDFLNHGIYMDGDPADPAQSIQAFYLMGTLHVRRLSDPYPKGTSRKTAHDLLEHASQQVGGHAMDHAEGFGSLLQDRMKQTADEISAGTHTATTGDYDQVMEALVSLTKDPFIQADTMLSLCNHPDIARAQMDRRPELFTTATPEQAQAILQTAQDTGLHPQLTHLLRQLLENGSSYLIQPDPGLTEDEVTGLLNLAYPVCPETRTMTQVAQSLGTSPWDNPTVKTWLFIHDQIQIHDEDRFDD